jgi:hypothetical protein
MERKPVYRRRTKKDSFFILATPNLAIRRAPMTKSVTTPNPKRVAAGRQNQKKWRLTAEGRERLRQATLKNKPWRFSTGPRTPEGKAQVVLNGKKRQLGPLSVREIRADLAELRSLIAEMRTSRSAIE